MYSKRPVDYLNEIAVRHGIDREDALRMMVDAPAPKSAFSIETIKPEDVQVVFTGKNELPDDFDPEKLRSLARDAALMPSQGKLTSFQLKEQKRTYMTIEFVRNVDGDYKTEKVCGYLPADDVLRDPLMAYFLPVNITEGGVTKLMLIPRRNINTVRVYDAND